MTETASVASKKAAKVMQNMLDTDNIHEQFFDMYSKYKAIMDDISSNDNEFKICIELINMLLKSIVKQKIFSSNEEIDDINTEYLKFGLLPHFMAQLYTNFNSNDRLKVINLSDKYGKLFLNQCESWKILKKREQKIYDDLLDPNYDKIKRNPFQQRTQIITTEKLNREAHNFINSLMKKNTFLKKQIKDNNFRLFNDDEDEREYWLSLYQISIRDTIKTIKQNKQERPLCIMFNEEQKKQIETIKYKQTNIKNNKYINKYSYNINYNNNNNNNNDSNNISSNKAIKITQIDANGKVSSFNNLKEFGLYVNSVDNQIKLKTDKKKIFRDPNPWIYTPEEAAELGMLPEVPKDYKQKSIKKQQDRIRQNKYYKRYGKYMNYDENKDDGSELIPNEQEFTMRGNVKTITMQNMKNNDDTKPEEEMSDNEYNQYLKDKREMANYKDDHKRGYGNPFL